MTPTPEGTITCSFTKDSSVQSSANFFTITGNYSNSKGKATVDGVEYTCCLKMESSTSVTFIATRSYTMTLYFGDTETASIKIDGNKIAGSGSTHTTTIEAGSHELTKDKAVNLFYIKLEPAE